MRYALLIVGLAGCGEVELDEPDACPAGTCLEGELGQYTVGPYEERDGLCFSWTVDNDEPLYVNELTALNDGHFHHSNWFWVPDTEFDLPDGPWDCNENEFTELKAAVAGGVLFAQSTQLAEETQAFLPGYAVKVPARSRVIAFAHVLNLTDEPQTTNLRTRFSLLAEDEVTATLAPWRFNYSDLDIPAGEDTEHGGDCTIRDWYEGAADVPFDVRVHYILPHFHHLGHGFDAIVSGGPQDGESLLEMRYAYGHPFGHTFEQPVDLSTADGLRFACHHKNDTSADVGYGIGDQEMCVALLFVESEWMIDTAVHATTETGLSGEVHTRTGECTVFGAPFVH